MVLDSFRLDGKVALVTGASRGLGQGAAVALAEAGADVALLSQSASRETAEKVRALGRTAHLIEQDLVTATPEELDESIQSVEAELGRIDILVNNAGIIRRAPLLEHPAADWDAVMSVNLDAVFHLSQAAARRFVANGGGKIINVASMLSFQGGILVPGYAASKHAVAGLTKSFANELAARGVNVNAIAPGYMATDNTTAIRSDEAREKSILYRIPAGRWGTPADLQGAFVFLASSASDYVNGAVIPVDGGWLVR
ncbi:3-ketoacyl-ACP reductase [Sinomonas atrocyanea]|uniref:3-ketoacyl-ACP reductase n=1 Tax=Sinomonas atrocyanea TaxID=37927 RepID=A0A127A6U9_9MICC|nr:2-dehydro-3-deoxy-D-gluconate 5-dehydrogenase KduD [Sinomonas atrocyanea]AMM34345.1 3-ketoacyl-ACP reductase [Sinomonas atrocyanea]GEB64574.1 2-deoxy-D-gluconate 3-dehydrogenase [Sinomonas atrocyanea]GGG63830.1 2-deoxy-D-gluconate 3-dehydrogenase [Sinomonas atrocyanea]